MRDLLDWLETHVPNGRLQQDRDTYLARSPLREDTTPSFSVSLSKRCYHDFGTNEAGTLSQLAELMGVEAPEWDGGEAHERKNSPARTEAKKDTTGEAVRLWQSGKPAGEDHPYLVRKKVAPNGCRETLIKGERTLLVPAYNEQCTLVGLERIKSDGTKMHLGQKSGAFFLLGAVEDGKPIVLAEGFSTGASIRGGTGYPVVVCFGASNIPTLAKRVREKHPDMEIVAATDNDDAGHRAVEECPARTLVVIPDGAPGTDWNDVLCLMGADETRKLFDMKLEAARRKAAEHEETKEPDDPLDLQFYDELEFTEPEFLIDDLIEKHTTGLMYGATASKKSFLAVDMAACVAAGLPFHGRPVQRGAIVYLAGEGKAGIAKRVRAWEQHTGKSLKDSVFIVSGKAPRFGDAQGAREAIERIRKKLAKKNLDTVALIVVDTLARAAVGLDENSNQDMSEFVGVLDSIKNEFDCVVLTVHHSGHMEAGRARGASCVPAAMDFIYEVKADKPYVTLTATKMKDAEEPAPITFEQIEMVVMEAKDTKRGKPVTSLALEEVEDSPREKTKPLTKVQQFGLNTFREAARKTGTLDVQLEVWREFFYRAYTGDKQDTKRKAFDRAQKELVELGKLSVKDDIYSEAGEIADLIRNETAKRDTGQSGTLAGHVPLGTLNERDRPGHTPIGVSRCPACVPVENDTREEKEECPAVVLPDKEPEKEEQVFPPRGKSGASSKKKERTPAENLALKTFMIAAEKAGTLDKDGAFVGLHLDAWRPFFHEKHTGANIDAKNKAFDKAREQLADCGEMSAKNDYYRLSGVLADLEKGIVEKLRESGSHKSQEEVTGDAHVDVAPSGEGEKEPVLLLPRGSLEKYASTSGVPVEKIREGLKAWEECGRIVIVGEDIYERPGKAYPKKDLPEEAEGQDDEDAPSSGPEKGEEGPKDSSSRGDSDNGGVSVPDVSPTCTREETSDAPSEDLHPTPCIEPEKEEPVFLSRGEEAPAKAEGQDPDKGPEDSSSRGEDPGPVEEDPYAIIGM